MDERDIFLSEAFGPLSDAGLMNSLGPTPAGLLVTTAMFGIIAEVAGLDRRRALRRGIDRFLEHQWRKLTDEHMFVTFSTVNRRYEIEHLRRSVAMLSPGVRDALGREDALSVLEELQDAERCLEGLRTELLRLAEGAWTADAVPAA